MKERYTQNIISNFPYPIAVPFARLRTDECFDPGPLRLKYILTTGEAVTRFCGMVVLCEFRRILEEKTDHLHLDNWAFDFEQRLRTPSWGIWLQIIRECFGWLKINNLEPEDCFLSDLMLYQQGKPTPILKALEQLVELRNRISHDKLNALHAHQFEVLCEESFSCLKTVLEGMELFLDCELTLASEIHTHKQRKSDPVYHHRRKVFGGESDTFKGQREKLAVCWESQAIILKNLEKNYRINLDPFLIYEEKAGKAPDVFFFNGLKRLDCIEYAACKHGGSLQSSDTLRNEEITEEIANFLHLFKLPEEANDV